MLGCVEATMMAMTLNRLLNADGATVGYFTNDAAGRAAMQAARAEWNEHNAPNNLCRSIATPIKPLELEDVEPGDGDRVDYAMNVPARAHAWFFAGATDVIIQRHEINRCRCPGKSNRSADLGGPVEAAGVLYVLIVKAPK